MANPIAESIRMRGGVVDRGAAVTSLIVQEGGVCGVRVGSEEFARRLSYLQLIGAGAEAAQ